MKFKTPHNYFIILDQHDPESELTVGISVAVFKKWISAYEDFSFKQKDFTIKYASIQNQANPRQY